MFASLSIQISENPILSAILKQTAFSIILIGRPFNLVFFIISGEVAELVERFGISQQCKAVVDKLLQ